MPMRPLANACVPLRSKDFLLEAGMPISEALLCVSAWYHTMPGGAYAALDSFFVLLVLPSLICLCSFLLVHCMILLIHAL